MIIKKKIIANWINLKLQHFVNLLYRGVFLKKILLYTKRKMNINWVYFFADESFQYPHDKYKKLKSSLLKFGFAEFKNNQVELIDSIDSLKLEYANFEEIRFFISYFHLLGRLDISRNLSYKYVNQLLASYSSMNLNNQQISELSQAPIWSNELIDYNLVESLKYSFIFKKMSIHLLFDIAIYRGKIIDTSRLYNTNDFEYANYLEGKRVAILGPKIDPTHNNSILREILTYEVVIVPNHIEANFTNSNLKINVSYFNDFTQEKFIVSNPSNVDNLDFVVLKRNNIAQIKNYKFGCKFREAIRSPFHWLIGNPNMIPIVLYDLLHFNPKSIKVFGIDFWAGEFPYFEGYPSEIDNSIKLSHAEHNLLANLKYMKHLHKFGYYEIDEMGLNILSMNEDDYIRRIFSNYYSR